jgi:hypothetical protein
MGVESHPQEIERDTMRRRKEEEKRKKRGCSLSPRPNPREIFRGERESWS